MLRNLTEEHRDVVVLNSIDIKLKYCIEKRKENTILYNEKFVQICNDLGNKLYRFAMT